MVRGKKKRVSERKSDKRRERERGGERRRERGREIIWRELNLNDYLNICTRETLLLVVWEKRAIRNLVAFAPKNNDRLHPIGIQGETF